MNTEIFIIVTSLFTGGAERQAIWLANTLSNTGYSVNLLILKKGDELTYLVDKKIKIYRFQIYSIERSKKSFKNLRFIRLAVLSILKTRKAIRNSKKNNKVVISFLFHSYIIGYFASIFSKTKLIYSVRSDRLGKRGSKKIYLRHLIFRLITSKADSIVFNSKHGLQKFKDDIRRSNNFLYIQNGLLPIKEDIDHEVETKISNFLKDAKYKYLVAARVDPLNNFSNLIDSFAMLADENIDFKSIIFGRGEEAQLIEKKIRDFNLDSKILMMGNIKNASSYFHIFDLLIHPAFHAGFSNSISDAIKSDLNVAVGRIGDSEELFENKSLIFKSLDSLGIYNVLTKFNKMSLEDKRLLVINSKKNLYTLLDNKSTIKQWIDLIE